MTSEQSSPHRGPHRELPDEKSLAEAGEVMIKDKDGGQIPLKSLWTDKAQNERQLIVFVRHFFCGSCKMYVEALGQDLSPSTLSAANVQLTIIGCGEPVCIEKYAAETRCPFPIYADPGLQTYKILGMMSSLAQSTVPPDYIKVGFWQNAVRSMWSGLTSGHPLSAGPSAQNGGEWLFQGGALRWCHRMRNSTDHTEAKDLRTVLGIRA